MAFRKQLIEALSAEPRTVTRLARELGLPRRDLEEDLRHMIRSARAAGHDVMIEPARCRACDFVFGEDKLSKPSRCPQCRSTWLYEPVVRVNRARSGGNG